jgi:DNA-binding MarR family transcriptional regulator
MENSGSAAGTVTADGLATALTVDLERIMGLYRSLTEPGGLSLTAAATLTAVERSGPQRLTALAAREGVTQPAMTQLISRLEDRRETRASRLAVILAQLSPDHLAALDAARPALDALASVPRADEPQHIALRRTTS